jgi:hypothetical protein
MYQRVLAHGLLTCQRVAPTKGTRAGTLASLMLTGFSAG